MDILPLQSRHYGSWFIYCLQCKCQSSTTAVSDLNDGKGELRTEIEELETKVNEERQRYTEMTLRDGSTAAYVPHIQVSL